MSKVVVVAAAVAGYVLGTRAGRERYEQIQHQARQFWSDPRVQRKAEQAQGVAREKGAALQEKVASGSEDSRSGSQSGAASSSAAATTTQTPLRAGVQGDERSGRGSHG